MRWIVSSEFDICKNSDELKARREFIRSVTESEVTEWKSISANKFYCCDSMDGLNGIFITAHIGDIQRISCGEGVVNYDFVVANSCIWEKNLDKGVLKNLIQRNGGVELWFAKQGATVTYCDKKIHLCVEIKDVGKFGFSTSLSERNLFLNRRKGFMNALRESFVKVSLIEV